MKKFGIMTFHFSDNYGAVLQCYALRTAINSIPDCTAEIINYNPGRKYAWYTDDILQKKYLEKLDKYYRFNRDDNGITEEQFNNIAELEQEKYDGFIVGSDQVWNTAFSFFNTAYLLDFADSNKRKIAYAASVGLAVESPRLKRDVFEKNIPQFDYLSVREKTHKDFIGSFTDKNVEAVLDPTMLLESHNYDELIKDVEMEKSTEVEGDYIFFYYLKHDNKTPLACSFVNMLSRKYNLKVVHFYVDMPEHVFKNEDKSFYFDGPKEFLWYIKHAKIVVTNSFHGTVFSILYHKPFYTYIVKSMESRVVDLLSTLDVSDRIIRGYKPLGEVTFDIDFESVEKKLAKEREKSLRFLREALED